MPDFIFHARFGHSWKTPLFGLLLRVAGKRGGLIETKDMFPLKESGQGDNSGTPWSKPEKTRNYAITSYGNLAKLFGETPS